MMGLILDSKKYDPAGEATSAARPACKPDCELVGGMLSVMYITDTG